MKEYIEREATKELLERYGAVNNASALVDFIPAADVAPVVRCRECKHYREHRTKKYGNLMCSCTRMGKHDMDYPVKPDDFCSYGERRTTDAE